MFTTAMTIGYGDYVPRTHAGKAAVCIYIILDLCWIILLASRGYKTAKPAWMPNEDDSPAILDYTAPYSPGRSGRRRSRGGAAAHRDLGMSSA